MSFDVALLGTGVAPLVAANRLLTEGRSVLVVNPDFDFFNEDSELPFDPFYPASSRTLAKAALEENLVERAIVELRPDFPGAIETWPYKGKRDEFHDPTAPHVRARARYWVRPVDHRNRTLRSREWEAIEDMYVEASDAGLSPQIFQGLVALRKFPGVAAKMSAREDEVRGVWLPKLADVDVARYRNGLLEFVRERLGSERLICGASQIELFQDGVRFYSGGSARTARVKDLLVFWTPRLTQWILAQAKRAEVDASRSLGIRLWEEWRLLSRDALDPGIIGVFEDMSVWADVEGSPSPESELHGLNVLRAGPLVAEDSLERAWAGQTSFSSLFRLGHDFLGWEKFSVRSLKTRAISEWETDKNWSLSGGGVRARVITGCDGPLLKVVRTARSACEELP